jgi:hypothetical protein
MFYESLYKVKGLGSAMATKWMLVRGLLPEKFAARLNVKAAKFEEALEELIADTPDMGIPKFSFKVKLAKPVEASRTASEPKKPIVIKTSIKFPVPITKPKFTAKLPGKFNFNIVKGLTALKLQDK